MQTRAEDDPNVTASIDRKIPLWGVLCALAIVAGQAIAVYYGQQQQTRDISQIKSDVSDTRTDVRSALAEINKLTITNVEVKFRLTDLERRLVAVEAQQQQKAK